MEFYLIIFLMTLGCAGILYLFFKYPKLKEFIPFFRYLANTVSFSLAYWNLDKHYINSFDAAAKFSVLLETINLNNTNLDDPIIRDKIAKFVRDNYKLLYDSSNRDIEAEKISAGAFVLIMNNEQLRLTIQSLIENRPEDIEVKKLTVICIDVFGLLFNLKDKLSLEYYQHLIYAINKVLLTVRDEGFTERGIKDAGAVMFRMYKITQAFKKQQAYSVKEFYGKIQAILDHFYGH